MRVVLRKATHTHQAVQGAGFFVAVHQAQLSHPAGQIAVAPHAALECQDAARAVHRLDGIILIIDPGGVHILAVGDPMTALLPQRAVEDDRGFHFLIARVLVDLMPVVFQCVSQHHTLWVEEGKAGAFIQDVEKIKLAAQLAVIALLGFFQHFQILVQFFLVAESGAVDALEHLVFLVAAPVGSGYAGELEGLDAAGAWQMRTRAQVRKITLAVEGKHLIFRQITDQFHFIRLVLLLHEGDSLIAGQGETHFAVILLDDMLHLFFDLFKGLGRKRLFHVEVVVEAVFDRGADRQLGIGVQRFDSGSQHMGGCMAKNALGLVIFKGQIFKRPILPDRGHQLDQLTVEPGCDGCFLQLAV